MSWADLLEALRTANPWLALVALFLLAYRVGDAWAHRPRLEKQVRMVFGGYVIAAGLGAAQANYMEAPVGPVTVVLTSLHVTLIVLMVRWDPHDPEIDPRHRSQR